MLLVIAFAAAFACAAATTACAQSDQDRIIELTQESAHGVEHVDNPQVTQIAIVDDYALATYQGANGGGQAVLKKSTFTWTVLGVHDSMIDAAGLGGFGVPSETAYKLESSLQPVSSQ